MSRPKDRDTVASHKKAGDVPAGALEGPEEMSPEEEEILRWLKETKFRKVAFGGVSEADVWKKISELNDLYDAAFRAQRAHYEALLGLHEGQDGLGRPHG